MRREKPEELCKGIWNYKRFDRKWLYECVHSFWLYTLSSLGRHWASSMWALYMLNPATSTAQDIGLPGAVCVIQSPPSRQGWWYPATVHTLRIPVWPGECMPTPTIHFCVLHIVLLVATRCPANAVAQIYKMLSRPSKCVLICGCKCKGKSHHFMSRLWTYPVLFQVR